MTLHGFSQTNRYLSVTTPLGDGMLDLVAVHGSEGISRPFHYQLDMRSGNGSLDFSAIVGQPISITMLRGDGQPRYLSGICTRFVQAGRDARSYRYRADLRPWTWLLGLTRDCRIFQKMSVPDIVTKLFSDLGFSDFRNACTGSYAARDYCVQYNETALDFVSRRLEEEGIFYYFEHAAGSHTLVLADDAAGQAACPGLAQLPWRQNGQQSWLDPEVILDCAIEQQVTTGVYVVDDFNFETPSTALRSQASGGGSLKIYDYPSLFSAKSDGESRAECWLEGCETGARLLRGEGSARSLVSGYTTAVTGHYRDDVNDIYLITALEVQASADGYANRFEAVPASSPFRPPRQTRRPTIAGTQTAIVTGPSGKEVWTDQYGRVKVQFHWDQLGKNDDQSSCWIRVSQNWAGKSWGAFFLPRIGMEVVVSFLEGNPDRPLITGAVYNGDQTVPYALPDNQTRSTVKTNSSTGGKGFNEIRFEDKADSEELFVQAQKDMTLQVNNDRTDTIHNNRTVTIEEGNESLTVSKGDRSITVSKGGDSLTVSEGDRSISVAKGKETHGVKGTRDLTVEGAETHTNKDAFTQTVSGDFSLKVDGNLTLSVGGNITIKADGSLTVQAGTSLELKAGTSLQAEAGTALTNKAGTDLTNQAGVGLTNKGVTVTNDASAQLTNKAGAMQQVDGGGMLTLKGGLVQIN